MFILCMVSFVADVVLEGAIKNMVPKLQKLIQYFCSSALHTPVVCQFCQLSVNGLVPVLQNCFSFVTDAQGE